MAINLRREALACGAEEGLRRHEQLLASLESNDRRRILDDLDAHGTRRFLDDGEPEDTSVASVPAVGVTAP